MASYAAEEAAVTAPPNESSVETHEKESASGGLSANLGLTSDFIFRGQTLTDHRPAAQGGLDWTHPSGFYLGTWGSNVHIPDSPAKAEVDFYGGYNYSITSSLSAGLGVMYYSYYRGSEGNTVEYPLQLNWKELKLGASYSPHWGGGDAGHAWYLSSGWSKKLLWQTTLGLNAGYSMFAPELGYKDYADFHLGLSRDMLGVTWDVSGYFVNVEQFNGADDPRAVLSITKTL